MGNVPILSDNDFKWLIDKSPLFALDFVVINKINEVLLGKRLNEPARGFWFVPGGRVRKNESLNQAGKRILVEELNFELDLDGSELLGVFDHFYNNSFFGEEINTHYVTATYLIHIESIDFRFLPKVQHAEYRWMKIADMEYDSSVHFYSKVFIPILRSKLRLDD